MLTIVRALKSKAGNTVAPENACGATVLALASLVTIVEVFAPCLNEWAAIPPFNPAFGLGDASGEIDRKAVAFNPSNATRPTRPMTRKAAPER